MQVSVLVSAGPNSPAAVSALQYCQALVSINHKPHIVFFYQDGVLLAQNHLHLGPGEFSLAEAWQQFLEQEGITAVARTASAVRRGVYDEQAAAQYQQHPTLARPFTLAGLGTWAEAVRESHKVISF